MSTDCFGYFRSFFWPGSRDLLGHLEAPIPHHLSTAKSISPFAKGLCQHHPPLLGQDGVVRPCRIPRMVVEESALHATIESRNPIGLGPVDRNRTVDML